MVRSGNSREKDIGYMTLFGTKQAQNVRDFLSRPAVVLSEENQYLCSWRTHKIVREHRLGTRTFKASQVQLSLRLFPRFNRDLENTTTKFSFSVSIIAVLLLLLWAYYKGIVIEDTIWSSIFLLVLYDHFLCACPTSSSVPSASWCCVD